MGILSLKNAERLVKTLIGIGALLRTGAGDLASARTLIEVLTNASELDAAIRANGLHDLATRLAAQAERIAAEAEEQPDFASEGGRRALRDAMALFDQALDSAAPKAPDLAAAALDPNRVVAAMLDGIVTSPVGRHFAEGSLPRDFLTRICRPVLGELLKHGTFVAKLEPAMWRRTLEGHERTHAGLDEIKALLIAQTQGNPQAVAALEAEVATLRARYDGDGEKVANLLKLLLGKDIPPAHWASVLTEAEARVQDLIASTARISNDISERLCNLKAEALSALETRDLDRAEALFGEIRIARAEARQDSVRQEAEAVADLARVAAAKLELRRAATLLAEAASIAPAEDLKVRIRYELLGALMLLVHGHFFNQESSLKESIHILQKSVNFLKNKEVRAEEWLTTHLFLGIALRSLGVREGGTARLEEAIASFEEILEVSGAVQEKLGAEDGNNYIGNVRELAAQTQALLAKRQ